jgi:hypothetical protein
MAARAGPADLPRITAEPQLTAANIIRSMAVNAGLFRYLSHDFARIFLR